MKHDMDWLVAAYGGFFGKFGISKAELTSHYEDWQAQSGNSSVKEYLWYLFHVLIGETKKQVTSPSDLHRNLHDIFLQMLEFRVNTESQNGNPIIQLIIRNRIQQWQAELTYKFRVQAIAMNCCPHCETINGQVFEPEQVLRHPHFASGKCTNKSGCSCGYIPVAVTGEN